MSPRELAILILGLAIIAVVLRGLYIAMNGRRGQIRLAIDKNIPRDVDLNALELAELPSGGGRVVERSFAEVNRQNHAVASASAKAAKLNLGDRKATAAAIPVLMDPVTLNKEKLAQARSDSDPVAINAPVAQMTTAVVDNANSEAARSHTANAAAAIKSTQSAADYQGDDDDYDEDEYEDEDDYEDDMDEDESEFEDDEYEDLEEEDDEFEDDDEEEDVEDEDEEDFDDDDLDEDDYDPLEEDEDDLIDSDMEDELGYVDDDTDEFSMTAGERIGFSPATTRPAQQTSLFNDDEVEVTKPDQANKRNPLFAAFARKPNSTETPVREASPSISGKSTSSTSSIPATPNPTAASKPKLTEKPQVIVAKPKPARVAPVRESLKTKEAAVEPVYDKAAAEPSEVVVLNAMAKPGRLFTGDDLLHVLITSGMKFGDMNIFHRRLGGDSKGPVIFSIANILNPGTFDLNRMHEFTTVGVSLFLAMPTSIKNLEAFEQMLGVAQQICSSLDGDLRDDNRNLMTAQTIEHYRQRIRDFELRRLKSVGARG